jgi:hypothetical protein
MRSVVKMTIQEIIDKLEQIEGVMDTDFLNRHAIEGIVKDIKTLRWNIIDEFDAPGIN